MREISNEENMLANAWKERYNSLSDEIKKRLDEDDYKQLEIIKRKRKEINEGDVFILSPEKGIYFYGKVLKAKINNKYNSFIRGEYLVFIFKCKTKNISIEDFKPDYNELLIQPAIVGKEYWTQGLFYTIGNIPLTEEEKNLDYGFYSVINGMFYKENGVLIKKKPKIYGCYGITTDIGISMYIRKELIIDPSLLQFK